MGLGNVAIDHVIRPIKLKITNIFFDLAQKLQVLLMYFKAQSIVTRATSIYLFIVTYISNRSWTEKIAFPFQNINTLSITTITIVLYFLTKNSEGFYSAELVNNLMKNISPNFSSQILIYKSRSQEHPTIVRYFCVSDIFAFTHHTNEY